MTAQAEIKEFYSKLFQKDKEINELWKTCKKHDNPSKDNMQNRGSMH